MTSSGSFSLLSIARSSLIAHQSAINVVGNNISNVSSDGFVRRRPNLEAIASEGMDRLQIGRGVTLASISRFNDPFAYRRLVAATSEFEGAKSANDIAKRVEEIFPIGPDAQNIGTALEEFFNSVADLTSNPNSPQKHLAVQSKSEALTAQINTTFNALASLQRDLDSQITNAATEITGLLNGIAQSNNQIVSGGGVSGGQFDALDQRDTLIRRLAERIDIRVSDNSDGSVNIWLANGSALVQGTEHAKLATITSGGAALDGGTLHRIAIDGPNGIDLTETIAAGEGSLGALLRGRGVVSPNSDSPLAGAGEILTVASRLEGLSRTLLFDLNKVYRGVREQNLASNGGNPFLDDEDPQASPNTFDSPTAYLDETSGTWREPPVFGLFTVAGITDVGGLQGLADAADLAAIGGQNTLISGKLRSALSTINPFATARDFDPTPGQNTFRPGDATNAQAILRTRDLKFNIGTGSVLTKGTLSELFATTTSGIGLTASRAQSKAGSTKISFDTAYAENQMSSGINLDEELVTLTQYQRGYEASARLVRVADEMLESVLGLI